jgi:hypothetical protein
MKKYLASLTALTLLSACLPIQVKDQAGQDLVTAPKVYTLVNLHPDPVRRRMYAVNYQLPGLIPRCTEVDLTAATSKKITFINKANNQEYIYINHRAAAEPFETHLLHFFGTNCDKNAVKRLSEVDQKGIKSGQALVGMSKQGVIYARGIPPKHVTPSTDMDTWTYWLNRFNRQKVVFDSAGKVSQIID